jgi:hypothetical protein
MLLLRAGAVAALDLEDGEGKRPIDHARDKGHVQLFDFLDPTAVDRILSSGGFGDVSSNAVLEAHIDKSLAASRAPPKPRMSLFMGDASLERANARRRGSMAKQNFTLSELHAHCARLEAELHRVRHQKNKSHGNPLIGPLNEADIALYYKQLQQLGEDEVMKKLMEKELSGGLGLTVEDARSAIGQLRAVGRILGGQADSKDGAKGAKGPSKGPPLKGEGKGETKGPGAKGKGKGPPLPQGKGGTSRKGPPPPGKGKVPPTKGKAEGKGKKGDKGGKGSTNSFAGTGAAKAASKVQLKPLWWTKFVKGVNLKDGETTVWDHVECDMNILPVEEMVAKYAKNATAKKKNEGEEKREDRKDDKLIRIITDPGQVAGKEAALKKLPAPAEVARAVLELDDEILNTERLLRVMDSAVPNPEQYKELMEQIKANPGTPLALPEQYMKAIGEISGYRPRLDCWAFVVTYVEKKEQYEEALSKFEQIVSCFEQGKKSGLTSLLGLVLAMGNFLNDGTERCGADGFSFETLTLLDSVKDPEGKDLRYTLFQIMFLQREDESNKLVSELRPILQNVQRNLSKGDDGSEKLQKKVNVTFEDFDTCVGQLADEFTQRQDTMAMLMQYIDDH